MSYDGSISMNRKLTEEETHELRIKLIPYFTTDGGMGVDDMADFLDYIFTMVSNAKAVEYVVKELDGFCSPETSKKIGQELASHIALFNGASSGSVGDSNEDKQGSGTNPGKRVVSLKSSAERGNALTLAGALGASRVGGKNAKKETPKPHKKSPERSEEKQDKKEDVKKEERNRNDRRDSDQKGGGRGNRSVQGAAFDRLAKGNDRRDSRGQDNRDVDRRRDDRGDRRGRGRGGDRDRDNVPDRPPRRDDRPPRRDDRSPRREERVTGRDDRREGRGTPGRGPRDMGGRGGRDGGRNGGRDGGRGGRGGRDDRMSGQRRPRDSLESEPDFVPAEDNGGRRYAAPAGAFSGRDGPKRPRYEEGYEEGYAYEGHGGGYDHFDGGYGFSPYPPPFRGGRGFRGRGRGRGRGGRGFEEGGDAPTQTTPPGEGQPMVDGSGVENAGAHPSPMVQAAFGGFDYSGRGFRGGRGRGRGRGGRAQVLSMIQSKTWVRKKDDEAGDGNANADSNGNSNAAPSGDTES